MRAKGKQCQKYKGAFKYYVSICGGGSDQTYMYCLCGKGGLEAICLCKSPGSEFLSTSKWLKFEVFFILHI